VILRRIAENLKQHHWTGVFIELAIVVLGVFIGMQVSNWNEERRDRALAHQYLVRLHEDFVLSIQDAESNIDSMEEQVRLASLMVARLRECRLDDVQRADFATGLYLLGRIEPQTMRRGTIDELRSTGRIGIIRNLKLRQGLSNIVQQQQRSAEVLGFIVARRTPQIAYVDFRNSLFVPESGLDTSRPVTDQVAFDFPALCRDPAYINAVSHLQRAAGVVIGQNRALLEEYRAMVKMLDAELVKEPT